MANPESMQKLADRFMNDGQFREEMRQDPEGAVDLLDGTLIRIALAYVAQRNRAWDPAR